MEEGILFHSIVEENGKTIKENNMEKSHNIPINSLVELDYEDYRGDCFIKGKARLYVVGHNRDCDGTPLYSLAMETSTEIEESIYVDNYKKLYFGIEHGYSEESLKLVDLPCIDRFEGKYYFLSNFSESKMEYDGIAYPTVEHAYQAQKTTDFNTRIQIANLETPGKAKKFGQKVLLRPDWENAKINIMRQLVIKKFQDDDLKKKLLDTRDVKLIEGNHWGDCFWGRCGGIGRNHLGKILMEVRDSLRNENKTT